MSDTLLINFSKHMRVSACVFTALGLVVVNTFEIGAAPEKMRTFAPLHSVVVRAIVPDPLATSPCPEIIPAKCQYVLRQQMAAWVMDVKMEVQQGGFSISPLSELEYRTGAAFDIQPPLPFQYPQDDVQSSSASDVLSLSPSFLDDEHRRLGFGSNTKEGLPASNDEFGPRTVTFKMKDKVVDRVKVGLFYESMASDHPGGETGFASLIRSEDHPSSTAIKPPNFYYYYTQAVNSPYPLEYVADSSSGDLAFTVIGITYSGAIHLHNAIHMGRLAHGHQERMYFLPSNGVWTAMGMQHRYGIDVFAGAVAHENKHVEVFNRHKEEWSSGNIVDSDADGLSDSYEIENGLDPLNPDGSGFGTGIWVNGLHRFGYKGSTAVWDTSSGNWHTIDSFDLEAIANLQEQFVEGPREKDWADDGLNGATASRFGGPICGGLRNEIEWKEAGR